MGVGRRVGSVISRSACAAGALLWASACGHAPDPGGASPSVDAAVPTDAATETSAELEAAPASGDGGVDVMLHEAGAADAPVVEAMVVTPGAACTASDFGDHGQVTTAVGSGSDVAYALVVDEQGRFVAAGTSWNGSSYDFALTRHSKEGVPDETFGTGGIVTTAASPGRDNYVLGVALEPDGSIVAAGSSWKDSVGRIAIARYLANGTLDGSFGTEGIALSAMSAESLSANAVLGGDSGKIVLAGGVSEGSVASDFLAVRFDAAGNVDDAFGNHGRATSDFGAFDEALGAARANDGKIVLGGYTESSDGALFAATRLTAEGTPDLEFGFTGKITVDFGGGSNVANAIAIQPDGKILLAGVHDDGVHQQIALARLTSRGELDATFGAGGKVLTSVGMNSVANAIVIYPSGRIAVAGESDHAALVVRYDASGALDAMLGASAAVTIPAGGPEAQARAQAAILESNGSLALAGAANAGANDDFGLSALCP
jgi:uncharacterized delta-60 repeat protein